MRATVWSLSELGPVAVLNSPKLLPPKGAEYSSNNKFLALLERHDSKDWVSIYYAGHDWKLINNFEVTGDMLDA